MPQQKETILANAASAHPVRERLPESASTQRIASYDVFDTVLTRAVGSPHAVFLLLGNHLSSQGLIEVSAERFARARIHAQRAAFDKPDISEVTMPAIYNELQSLLGLSAENAAELMKQECDLEARLLTSVPGANAMVAEALQRGCKVVFISDMYLPSTLIREQLIRNGFAAEAGNCFVSNDFLRTKRSGELFKIVAQQCGAPPPDFFTHHGDNKKSDFDAPRRLNWRAVHYRETCPNRFEDILNSFDWDTGGLSAAMAGASRLARLSIRSADADQKEVVKIAAGVAAPALTAYVLWVLKRAQERGLQRLYFVSRDGQIFLKIAQILIKRLGLQLEPRYLYVSRKVLRFASLDDPESVKSLIGKKVSGELLSVERALSRVSLDPIEIESRLASAGLPKGQWRRDLSDKEIETLVTVTSHTDVQQIILQKADQSRELLFKYLLQENLPQDDKWALVDIGWGGNSQDYLERVLQIKGAGRAKGFYFICRAHEGDKEGFLVDRPRNRGYVRSCKRGVISTGLVESFCTADQGTVQGYAQEGDRVVPVLESLDPRIRADWDLEAIHRVICSFNESLFLDSRYLDPWTNLKPMVAALLKSFCKTPTREEAHAWGRFLLEENAYETRFLPLAVPYRLRDLWRVLKHGDVLQNNTSWDDGALAMTSSPMRSAVVYTAKAGRFLRRLVGRFR